MLVMQNFELASRSVPNKSYEARRKLWPLIEVLRYRGIIENCQFDLQYVILVRCR